MKINLLVPGFGKCGTTFLHSILSRNEIIAPMKVKEPGYFYACNHHELVKSDPSLNELITCEKKYIELFDLEASNRLPYLGDFSTMYVWDVKSTILSMKKSGLLAHDCKVIILIRDPINRLVSQFDYFTMRGLEHRDINSCIRSELNGADISLGPSYYYVKEGVYSEAIKLYKENFQDVLIVKFEDLFTSKNGIAQIEEFLNIQNIEIDRSKKVNKSGVLRNKTYSTIVEFLIDIAADKKLNKMISNQARSWIKRRIRETTIKTDKSQINSDLTNELLEYYRSDQAALKKLIGFSYF